MFRKIGSYSIVAEADLILVWSSPVFNLESAQEYAAEMARTIDRMPEAFGVLAQFDEPPILGPEVEASMRETAQQRAQRGMVAVAFVVAGEHGLAIASQQWGRMYASIGIPLAFFSDLDRARTWLREQIGGVNRLLHAGDGSS